MQTWLGQTGGSRGCLIDHKYFNHCSKKFQSSLISKQRSLPAVPQKPWEGQEEQTSDSILSSQDSLQPLSPTSGESDGMKPGSAKAHPCATLESGINTIVKPAQ